MKNLHLAAGLVAALAAGTAQAQNLGIAGGEIDYSVTRNKTSGFDQNQLEGSVVLDFGSGFSAQVDFASSRYSFGSDSTTTAGVHLIYSISPNMTTGIYYAKDRISGIPNFNTSYGVELAYVTGNFSTEAQIGKYNSPGLGANLSVASLAASYELGSNFSVDTGVQTMKDGTVSVRQLSLGGKYAFGNGMNVEATFYRRNWTGGGSDNAVGIKFGYEFGKGATFGRRGFFQQWPAFL